MANPQTLTNAAQGGLLYGGGAAAATWMGGAGFWEGAGAGLGGLAGGFGGGAVGGALGGAAGGAVGTIPAPIVGTVSGAAVGGYVGIGIGAGIGGGVGSSLGGRLGRLIDNLIPDFFGGPGYPNEFDPNAVDAGAIVSPGTPPPFAGGQSPGILYSVAYRYDTISTTGQTIVLDFDRIVSRIGPISGLLTQSLGGESWIDIVSGNGRERLHSSSAAQGDYRNVRIVAVVRVDGQPDTGGNPPGGIDPVREPNPARQSSPGAAPRTLSPPLPQPTQGDNPWPGIAPQVTPDTTPIAPPDQVPNFAPTPTPTQDPAPTPDTTPTPTDLEAPSETPSNLPNPTETPSRLRPTIIPIVIGIGAGIGLAERTGILRGGSPFLSPLNRSSSPGLVPTPVAIPAGGQQPVTTPSGPQVGTPPNENPNVDLIPSAVEQAPTLSGSCCIPPTDQEILKRLEQIKKGIGVDGLPASVVDQIAKDRPGQIQIGSLAELHLWQVQQLDGVLGKWPVGIPVPTPAGTTTVGMPNVAEAVAEMVGMLVSQQVTAAQILNTSSRAMVQAGSATQQAHLAHLTAKANADFLGYESRANAVDMPLTYTPGKDLTEGLLSESTAKIRGFENTDTTDIKAIFAELLHAAAIIRAVYWRRLDPKGDLKKQIQRNIKGGAAFMDEAAAATGDDSDWEAYLKAVEEGFGKVTGDKTPYGRNPAEGPQIKDRSREDDKK
ncbi:hypothetical protein PGN35_000385 [Nodosilinea sp. PGN35]|uniref:hypothetical protein n=1 Tax=Nodosilinea sp. PGN35 TaxID=3020489 RepID=UPI00398A8E96